MESSSSSLLLGSVSSQIQCARIQNVHGLGFHDQQQAVLLDRKKGPSVVVIVKRLWWCWWLGCCCCLGVRRRRSRRWRFTHRELRDLEYTDRVDEQHAAKEGVRYQRMFLLSVMAMSLVVERRFVRCR